MVEALNKLFTVTLKFSPDIWLALALGIVVVAFAVTLIAGLLSGEFKNVKGLMARVVSKPAAVLPIMQKMPIHISKQYKRARMNNMKPSDLVTEQECVTLPYKRSLISKIWVVTFVATVIAAGIAFCAGPVAYAAAANAGGEVNDSVLSMATYLMPLLTLIVGGLLTLLGAIIGKVSYGGALKTYAKFVAAIDGDHGQAQTAQPQAEQQPQQAAYAYGGAEPVAEAQAEYAEPVAQPVYNEAQPVYGEAPAYGDTNAQSGAYVEPEPMAAEPVVEPVVQTVSAESEEDFRRRAREEAMAAMRAQQEEAARAAQARQQAQQQQQQFQQVPPQQPQFQQAAPQQSFQQAQPQPAPAGSSSADEVIARIDQIEREGASREAMREVATQLQKERAKPENKTPEQQKRLNEALSKLLKAMSAASKK